MKNLLLLISLSAILCQVGIADEDPNWKVRFYQDPNAGGRWTKFDVSPDGASAVPIDQFEKYDLQDEISEIRYKLPRGVAVVCYTGRFFKSADGDIPNFINNSQFLKEWAGKAGIRFGKGVLVLDGTGKEEVAQLWVIQNGAYDNKIRSAKLIKQP